MYRFDSFAAVGSRNHERLSVDGEADVAEKSFIEDAIDGFAIVDATIGFADDTSPRGGHFMFGHLGTDSRQAPRMGVKESVTFGRWASGGGWSAV